MAEPDRTNADAERVSDIVARLRADADICAASISETINQVGRNCEAAADIIEAQSKALAEAREILRRALDCGTAVVGADPSDPDAEEAFSMWSDARTAGRQFLVGARS